jgi:hypothetical protein
MRKVVLRRVREAWSDLHGEVSFEELLVTDVLRESGRTVIVGDEEYELLGLIDGNLDWVRQQSGDRQSARRRTPTPTEETLKGLLGLDGDPESKLYTYLFGARDPRRRPQSVALDHPTDYWARIRSEGINERVRDQQVLAVLDGFSEEDAKATQQLNDWTMKRTEEATKVIQFAHRLGSDGLVRLAGLTLETLASSPRTAPADEHAHPDCLINLALLFNSVFVKPERRLGLAREAITHIMPQDLSTAHRVEYWLVNRPGTTERSPDSKEQRQGVASHIFNTFKKVFGGKDGVKQLIAAMSQDQPWELSWLFNRKWDKPQDAPTISKSDWAEIAPILVSAAEEFPRTGGRAMAVLLTDGGMSLEPSIDEETGQLKSRDQWKAHFNETRATEILGSLLDRGIAALRKVPTENLEGEALALVTAAVEFARKWRRK